MKSNTALLATFMSAVLSLGAGNAVAANNTNVLDLFVEPPTLSSLGFEWRIDGDDNRNATVASFSARRARFAYKQGMPMLRLQGERTFENVRFDVISPNMFAGSIVDLEPDTDYDVILLRLRSGRRERRANKKQLRVHTRPEPKPVAGGRVFHVYPFGFTGTMIQPAFLGLMAAYNNSSSGTDMTMATRPRVRPGDTILVHAGLYINQREIYSNTLSIDTVPFDGTYHLHWKRHGRRADRDQGGGRRRGGVRLQWRVQLLRREERRLQLLRRLDHPQY